MSKNIHVLKRLAIRIIFLLAVSCIVLAETPAMKSTARLHHDKKIINAAFLCVDGVYNSELMAPYDVLQHSIFRDSTNYIRCFIVTPDGRPFVTFEGIRITPDYSFEDVPKVDILIIPSTKTSMTDDLKNTVLMSWLKNVVKKASHVITVVMAPFHLLQPEN
ncbi:DJ-1/PfpI family protein [bacterium]|nr:DJ-1/PfpI family protein [bacterium]